MRISDWSSDVCSTDIVVTARRRDERLQDVPVSVSAFSTEALERSTIQTLQDINTITPGFRAGAEGGTVNISISLRGIGQVPLGDASRSEDRRVGNEGVRTCKYRWSPCN